MSDTDEVTEKSMILVADDSPTNRDVIKRHLQFLGYACELANDGMAALAAWKTGLFCLLLTDCQMPGMDGYALTSRIRELEEAQGLDRLPIIAVSASVNEEEMDVCLDRGMDDYLVKPVDRRTLGKKLRYWAPHLKPDISVVSVEYSGGRAAPARECPDGQEDSGNAVDPEVLKSVLGDDVDSIRLILNDFVDSSIETVRQIGQAFADESPEEISQAAHKLKSAALTVGANGLGDLCLTLEAAGKAADFSLIRNEIGRLPPAFEEVKAYVRSYQASASPPNS